MEKKIKKIGVLTSGGDAPGMNAAIRAVVRGALFNDIEVYGIYRGFAGLLDGDIKPLNSRNVSEQIQRGGTFLMTARCKEFMTEEGVKKAARIIEAFELDAVVVIGGDGSFHGAQDLSKQGVNVICIPATIDNDVACTDYTIGYDTAMNTALDAIDKLRDTASSHERCTVVEVMGRRAGYIAFNVGIASGAEIILIPEIPYNLDTDVIKVIMQARNKGKHHYIVVVAEGAGNVMDIAKQIEEVTGVESKATVLGHIQRGGSPTLMDRNMASRMGLASIQCILEEKKNRIIVSQDYDVKDIDIDEGLAMTKGITEEEYKVMKMLF